MNEDDPYRAQRQTFLPLILGTAALGGILVFLILVSVGYFLYVLLGVFLIGAVGLMHYLAWGQSLHQQTEGEREEERLREESEADPW
jgi:hypothetical protein